MVWRGVKEAIYVKKSNHPSTEEETWDTIFLPPTLLSFPPFPFHTGQKTHLNPLLLAFSAVWKRLIGIESRVNYRLHLWLALMWKSHRVNTLNLRMTEVMKACLLRLYLLRLFAISATNSNRLRSISPRTSFSLRWVCILWKSDKSTRYKVTLTILSLASMLAAFCCLLHCSSSLFYALLFTATYDRHLSLHCFPVKTAGDHQTLVCLHCEIVQWPIHSGSIRV